MAHEFQGDRERDPLRLLPSELVLRILDFTSAESLARLTSLNTSWHTFIDKTHQDSIYSSPTKTSHPLGAKDFSWLRESSSHSKWLRPEEIASWKDLCKRQTLLERNWKRKQPELRESIIQVGDVPIWRFKPDFKRRLILSTSQGGAFKVTDMDSGNLLWSLESVRPFAHLEYQDGTAVWDREGNAVEVWRTEQEGTSRGEFKQVAILPHESTTRGFQLSFDTLCVVSSDGEGFVYGNMTTGTPSLKTHIRDLQEGAVGHLDQCHDTVAYSLGPKGYHFFDKSSGRFLGVLNPRLCGHSFSHILHPDAAYRGFPINESSTTGPFNGLPGLTSPDRNAELHFRRGLQPLDDGRSGHTVPLKVLDGRLPLDDGEFMPLDEDEFGAGMFSRTSDLFVGISRGGRVFICTDWRKAISSTSEFNKQTAIVECDSDGSTFDLGGWLSVKDHRIMFEIQDRVYVLGLTENDRLDKTASRPSFAFASSLSQKLAVPISFMAMYDDCIMATYTTLRNRTRRLLARQPYRRLGVLPTKCIRVLSFAPIPAESDRNGEIESDTIATPNNEEIDIRQITNEDIFELIERLADEDDDALTDMAVVGDLEDDFI